MKLILYVQGVLIVLILNERHSKAANALCVSERAIGRTRGKENVLCE